MKAPRLACGLALLLGATAPAPAQPAEAAGSQDPLELQHARAAWLKSRSERVYYTQRFDLSALPEYVPGPALNGTIRQWGSNYLADSMLARYLEGEFRRFQPGVTFSDNLSSTFIGMASLYMGRADLAAMGRRATWDELQAFQRVLDSPPVEVAMATGSLDVAGWTFALVIFVHHDNPLANITLAQLDGIFGAQRDGGWKGNQWDPSAARDRTRTCGHGASSASPARGRSGRSTSTATTSTTTSRATSPRR